MNSTLFRACVLSEVEISTGMNSTWVSPQVLRRTRQPLDKARTGCSAASSTPQQPSPSRRLARCAHTAQRAAAPCCSCAAALHCNPLVLSTLHHSLQIRLPPSRSRQAPSLRSRTLLGKLFPRQKMAPISSAPPRALLLGSCTLGQHCTFGSGLSQNCCLT